MMASSYEYMASGRWQNHGGYFETYVPNHPFNSNGCIKEHRLIWEQHNKAMLLPWAIVHHINKDTTDNRIENLDAMTHDQHNSIHQTGSKRSDVAREKMRQAKIGYTPWNKGVHGKQQHSERTREKMRISQRQRRTIEMKSMKGNRGANTWTLNLG